MRLDMFTSKDLAKLAGVSQITVSRALNNSPLVKEDTKKRILQLANEHHYELNSFAQSMRTKKTGSIGLMLARHFTHTNQNLYASSLLSYLLLELEASGYDIIPTTNHHMSGNKSHIENILAKRKIDGLIVIRNSVSDEVFDMLDLYKIPCVFITQTHPEERVQYSIQLDHYKSGYLVGEYFSKINLRSIMTIAGPKNTPDTISRLQGLSDSREKYGFTLNSESILYCDYSFSDGYNITKNNLDIIKNSEGIYCQNDPCAIGCIKALKENQIDLKKIRIISGDGTPITEWNSPSLSTIYAPSEQIAQKAVSLICHLLKNNTIDNKPIHLVVSPRLLIRES